MRSVTLVVAAILIVVTIVSNLVPPAPVPAYAAPPDSVPIALPPVRQSGDRFGVVEAFKAPDLARNAGARWERIVFFWDSIQPNSPDQWNGNLYSTDQQIDAEVAAGMTLVGLLGNPPAWATRNGSVPKNLSLPLDDPNNYWARFVSKIVGRYAGKIDYWVIWNEPDIDPGQQGSTWAGYEEEYYQLLKTAYLVAKQVNPRAKIVFGGTTYWADVLMHRKLFLERVLERAVLDPSSKANNYYFDIVDIHIYSSPEQFLAIPAAYRDVLNRYQTDKPLWVSEANVVPWDDPLSKVPRGGYRATLSEQASFIIESMALSLVSDIQRFSIYKLVDDNIIGGEPYGLVRNDFSLRPAYVAYQVAVSYLSRPGRVSHQRDGSIESVTIDSGTAKTVVYWNNLPRPASVMVKPSGTRAKLVSKNGKETTLPLPSDPQMPYYVIALGEATANTADGDPNRYIIGGDPVIFVEEGIGDGIRVSDKRLYYPITGFGISNAFLAYFERRGGLRTFGYPISRPFKLLGYTVQFFQRQVMVLRPDGTVGTLNVLDEGLMPYTQINGASLPGIDVALTHSAPSPGSPNYSTAILDYVRKNAPNEWEGHPVNFGRTFGETVRGQEAYPEGKIPYQLIPGLNLELWGLPTSAPVYDPKNNRAIYQRFQRGLMHYDASTGRTQGMLLVQYLKSIMTGEEVPSDLEDQAKGSRFYKQYDNSKQSGVARPAQLPDTVLTNAFEREAP
ncbi:MAG: hypothetical protein M1343_09580 [Chloroflexi bacterium]|nr:hypothetical protein [Chloroflexota bacterium]MDA8186676.1 hypothetical protein [Dehalococcoidales bacterium]